MGWKQRLSALWDLVSDYLLVAATEALFVFCIVRMWPWLIPFVIAGIVLAAGIHIRMLNETMYKITLALASLSAKYDVVVQASVEARARAGEAEYLLEKELREKREAAEAAKAKLYESEPGSESDHTE
jgi:hypothetical protein